MSPSRPLYMFKAASRLQEHDAGSSAEDSDGEDLSDDEDEGVPCAKRRRLSDAKHHKRGVNRRLCQQVLCCSGSWPAHLL